MEKTASSSALKVSPKHYHATCVCHLDPLQSFETRKMGCHLQSWRACLCRSDHVQRSDLAVIGDLGRVVPCLRAVGSGKRAVNCKLLHTTASGHGDAACWSSIQREQSSTHTMRLKVVYTTLVEQQQQGSGTSGQANASASTSSFATGSNDSNSSNQQMRRTYVARGGITNQASALNGSAGQRYGQTTLKACMGLICYSRPDLIPNSRLDYAVSVLDVRETDDLGLTGSDRIWEGKGMMSWLLHEKGPGQKVIGRIVPNHQCDDDDQGTTDDGDRQLEQEKRFMLEVSIELMPVSDMIASSSMWPGESPIPSVSTSNKLAR